MDISAAVMVLGAATTLCGRFIPEFLGYGLTLYGIDNKEIWNKGSFPKSIRHIEETSGWRLVVRGYYLDRASIEWQGWAFVVSLILLWGTWLCLATFSTKLKSIAFSPDINLYEVAQIEVIILVVVWLVVLIRQWVTWGKRVKEICA